jgi:hemolysin III
MHTAPARGSRPDDGAAHRIGEAVGDAVSDAVAAVKPRLRGWLHAGTFPLAVAAGIVLICVAPTNAGRVSASVFTLTAALLFGTSAVYHRGTWSPRVQRLLKRLDHSNIFLIIAGSYTPFAALLLSPGRARTLLLIVWIGALAGVLFRVFWVGAPRWLYTPVYIALGWVAVIYLPDFLRAGGVALLTLIVVGGLLYTVGGVIYALKRPNPVPGVFGYHEVFHALVVAAAAAHFTAVAVYALPR